MSNRGQLAIFIIVGIILVASIGLFFVFRQGLIPGIGEGKEINPNNFLTNCLEEKMEESLEIISHQGGSISPLLNKKFRFSEDGQYWNITYLCYTSMYYDSCVNQEPLLINHLEDEIKNYIEGEARVCFDELENSLIKQDYEVKSRYKNLEIDLVSRKVKINLEGKMDLVKNEESSTLQNFKIESPTMIYDLAIVAQEIVAQESRNCYFPYTGYMLQYPEYKIEVFKVEDTKIYTIKLKESSNKFRFAVQGCRS